MSSGCEVTVGAPGVTVVVGLTPAGPTLVAFLSASCASLNRCVAEWMCLWADSKTVPSVVRSSVK